MTTSAISTKALESHVRRALAKEQQRLFRPRAEKDRHWLGEYAVIDASNLVVAYYCSIEDLAAELGVLA